jgi:hypothetical protein
LIKLRFFHKYLDLIDKGCGGKLTADLTPLSLKYGGESALLDETVCYWRITV